MRQRETRTFEDVVAVRSRVPLLVGLFGASSSGKTWSALELATGIQRVYGGDIHLADTDKGRGLHYADRFKYRYIPFNPPHESRAFVDLIHHYAAKGGVLIIDHMSAEHDGEGGMIETQKEVALERAGGDERRAKKMTAVAWGEAKSLHHELVRELQQTVTPIIICWRAKDKNDWSDQAGPKPLGMMPVGSKDLVFEMTQTFYLPPGARGMPDLSPTERGEILMVKTPEQFTGLVRKGEILTRDHGEAMARWAMGDVVRPPSAMFEGLRAAIELAGTVAEVVAAWPSVADAVKAKTITRAEGEQLKALGATRKATLAKPPSDPPPDRSPSADAG